MTADALALGDRVLDTEGASVEVEWVCPHQQSEEKIIVVETSTTRLLVTSSHRVVKLSVHGEEQDVFAEDVKSGDWILVGKDPEQVTVQSRVIETSTVELRFENDALVEAWFISYHGIVTKGQPVDELQDVGTQCKEEDVELDVPSEQFVSEHRGRRSRRSRQRYDKARKEIRRMRSPSP